MRNHTGIRPWQLSSTEGEIAVWAPGKSIRFLLNDVPELTAGVLCNHLLGILVTATVLIGAGGVQTASAAVDLFQRWLYESVEVRNAWHGTPVSQNHAKGCMLGLMEFLSCGYQYFGRRMSVPAVNALGGRYVKVNTFVPLAYLMGEKGHHTALPVTFYKNAELQINCGLGSADAHGEVANTLAGATLRASAIMLAESEIHLGPGGQFIDYQSPASANSEVVKLDSLGMNTSLQDVEAGAGVDFMGWLSSWYNQGQGFVGAARVKDITRVGIPFRGTQSTRHLEPFLAGFEAAIYGREDGESDEYDATAMNVVKSNLSGFPYAPNYAGPLVADMAADGSDIRDMLLFPIIYPGRDLEVTKMQSFEGTQSYFLNFQTALGPANGTTHHTFVHQFFSWTPAKWDDALRTLVNSGVARAVLGEDRGLVWSTKFSKKNASPGLVDPAKVRYLAQKLTLGKAA
jgi:hypothetical protein